MINELTFTKWRIKQGQQENGRMVTKWLVLVMRFYSETGTSIISVKRKIPS